MFHKLTSLFQKIEGNQDPAIISPEPNELQQKKQETENLRHQLEKNKNKIEENDKKIEILKKEAAQIHQKIECLDAIGPQKEGEFGIAYAARVETAIPGIGKEESILYAIIKQIPPDGAKLEEALLNETLKILQQDPQLKKIAGLFEDGIVTRDDIVQLYIAAGKKSLNEGIKTQMTNDEIKTLKENLEKIGIHISDNDAHSLAILESSLKADINTAIKSYQKEHPQAVPETCQDLNKPPENNKEASPPSGPNPFR